MADVSEIAIADHGVQSQLIGHEPNSYPDRFSDGGLAEFDQCGEVATHIFNNTVHCFYEDYPVVKPAAAELKRQLKGSDLKWGDVTSEVALVMSMQEVMDNIAASKPKMSNCAFQGSAESHQVA